MTNSSDHSGDTYQQSGNFGIGHTSGGTIQDQAKVAGVINEATTLTNSSDQSRNFTVGDVGGDFKPVGSPILSDNANLSGTIAETINQLPKSADSTQPDIKDLLTQLHEAIKSSSDISDADKNEALKQLETLAKAPNTPNQQQTAKTVVRFFKGLASELPTATKLVTECNKLLPAIASWFGLTKVNKTVK
jgi:hypothetical protein